ncbi:MAG: DUF2293 domain-containing protein [Verrucomicrobiota bacterium]
MPDFENQTLQVKPARKDRHVTTADGKVIAVPKNWDLLPPGDAALSRRIKKDGPSWTVKEKKRGRDYSLGIWAPADRIAALKAERAKEQESPAYQKKLDAGRQRRAKKQVAYAEEFEAAIFSFLDFDARFAELALTLAKRISDHAVPVGSGTVARTQRIPIERRAEAATIAWMRHQTTAYDDMVIPRVKGKRREVRAMLAKRSRQILDSYRSGKASSENCPLKNALT